MLGLGRELSRRLGRSAVATATLAAVTACALGVPQPDSGVHKSHAERYPCENHPCGCADAASCWRDCCCMSNAEKLAWAAREGVAPPTFVVAAAARKAQDCDAFACDDSATHACCSTKLKTCCSKTRGAAGAVANSPSSKQHRSAKSGPRLVLLHAAMKCRGLTVSVALLPPSLPVGLSAFVPRPPERFAPPAVESLLYDAPYLAQAAPPPRAC